MEVLISPWRELYHPKNQIACPFCINDQSDIATKMIIKRFAHSYIIMNQYPYNPGHIMVIPYAHVSHIKDLQDDVLAELMIVTAYATRLLEACFGFTAFNTGLNLGGSVAGGSVPQHVHQHIVPRYPGDTNFLIVCADTKVITADIGRMYETLAHCAETFK